MFRHIYMPECMLSVFICCLSCPAAELKISSTLVFRMCYLCICSFCCRHLIATYYFFILSPFCCRMEILPCIGPPGMVIRLPSLSYSSRGSILELRTMYASKHSNIFVARCFDICISAYGLSLNDALHVWLPS